MSQAKARGRADRTHSAGHWGQFFKAGQFTKLNWPGSLTKSWRLFFSP